MIDRLRGLLRRSLPRILVVLGLALMAAWMILGHRFAAPKLRAELRAATGLDPEIGFVLVGPDLNLYAYDVRFEDERVHARASWAKFEIPLGAFWGDGSTRAVRVRRLGIRVRARADLSGLGRGRARTEEERPPAGPPPEFLCDELDVEIEHADGAVSPLLHADWLTALPRGEREVDVEIGPGRAGRLAFDGASSLVVRTRRHLLVSEFKMRALGGLVDGLLDLHLDSAGRFNGELRWDLMEVERLCRELGFAYAEKRRGTLAGGLRFEASRPSLEAVKGSGSVRMERAHYWSPITFKVVGVLGLPSRDESWIHRAEGSFSVEKGLLFLESGAVRGAEYELAVRGIVDLAGACDIEAEYEGTTLVIRGRLGDPDVKILPLNAVTVPFDRLYRERLDKKK